MGFDFETGPTPIKVNADDYAYMMRRAAITQYEDEPEISGSLQRTADLLEEMEEGTTVETLFQIVRDGPCIDPQPRPRKGPRGTTPIYPQN